MYTLVKERRFRCNALLEFHSNRAINYGLRNLGLYRFEITPSCLSRPAPHIVQIHCSVHISPLEKIKLRQNYLNINFYLVLSMHSYTHSTIDCRTNSTTQGDYSPTSTHIFLTPLSIDISLGPSDPWVTHSF